MKYPRTSARAIALTLKPVAAGFFLLLLFLGCLALLIAGKKHATALEEARMAVVNAATPIVQTLAKPMDAFHTAGNWIHEMATLHEENLRLKEENDRLLHWQTAATELASENDRLRTMLKFAPIKHGSYITARIAVDGTNLYSRSVVIDAGIQQGVVDDAAVVNETGLVGRIIEAGKKSARLMLMTDINSRIPVITQNSREHAIASGSGESVLSLLYLPENTRLRVGENVVTSGDGNVLPAGLPVGVITKVEKGVATVQTFADMHRLEFVNVLDTAK